jgi:hypothetical protein
MKQPQSFITIISLGIAASVSNAQSAGPHGKATSLSILPSVSRACPGDVIEAQYAVRFADGTSETLGRGEVASLVRKSDGAEPKSDGAWQTSVAALDAAFSGYRLSAALAADSSVHTDAVVAPAPECRHAPINLGVSGLYNSLSAHVRLGAMSTPFFDSIAVAVVEVGGSATVVTVLTPAEMKSGAIRVVAPGLQGRSGRPGRQGDNGDECQNGGSGDDGEPGEPGTSGGQVNIIVQTDAPWLANLVAVSNPGGLGGRGGAGGAGGYAGSRPSGRNCNPRSGRPGRNGSPGANGPPGLPPEVTTVPFTLLWTGSPIWTDERARRSLEALMQYTRQRAR